MRTSSSQFHLLVEYMERNGDLSKPTDGPQGRAANIQRWAELAALLNADATGDTKTADKWRKVWSDFKNNTKKKAARIYRAARGTGGGPACRIKLTDLEERALHIVGTQAATGIVEIQEVGLEDEVTEQLPAVTEQPPPSSTPDCLVEINDRETNSSLGDWNRPGTSSQLPLFPNICAVGISEPCLVGSEAVEASRPATVARALHEVDSAPPTARTPPPTRPSTSARRRVQQSPTPLPLTPRRRRRGQDPSSPIRRRTRTQTQSELARQAFVRSDSEWRSFQQETERERNRLREMELELQGRWLDMFGQLLVLANRYIDTVQNK